MGGSSSCLGAGILHATLWHFKAPPAPVLGAWDPVKLLDTTPFDKTDVFGDGNAYHVERLLTQNAELHAAVSL